MTVIYLFGKQLYHVRQILKYSPCESWFIMFCCIKYRDFTKFPAVETFWKRTVILPKLCGNCTLPQKFCSRKLGEISVFYPMFVLKVNRIKISLNLLNQLTNFLLSVGSFLVWNQHTFSNFELSRMWPLGNALFPKTLRFSFFRWLYQMSLKQNVWFLTSLIISATA